jgi:hypothetical protein
MGNLNKPQLSWSFWLLKAVGSKLQITCRGVSPSTARRRRLLSPTRMGMMLRAHPELFVLPRRQHVLELLGSGDRVES